MEKKLLNWLESHDCDDICPYCIYNDECPHGMVCYGGVPIEPFCCGREYDDYLDLDALAEDIEKETSNVTRK